ncbi:vp39-like protein [Esparto virus]|uniref:Vp39-like protein n=1 Tax=Esparto virus TaxID=2072209 RepID=A0A2I7G2Z7_9VIRU|nr:vp39-like protein [Esparto virus]AUQ44003.1 vp39-like protein [Esparto virus]
MSRQRNMSASLFTCQSAYNNSSSRGSPQCVFEGVSPCRDQVSHLICNEHSRLFGLIHQPASYCTDSGDVWTKINLYSASQNSLNIPLFMDINGKILMSEIKNFSINVCTRFPNINITEFQARIANLLGVQMYGISPDCDQSWLSEVTSSLIVRNNANGAYYYQNVSRLHKILFYYANVSNVRNSNTNTAIYLVPNLSLTYNNSSNVLSFIVINKKILLRYTDDPNCVATPIVLDGRRDISTGDQDQTIQRIAQPAMIC